MNDDDMISSMNDYKVYEVFSSRYKCVLIIYLAIFQLGTSKKVPGP
jgi:hypothetical protein